MIIDHNAQAFFDAHLHIIDSRFPLWLNQGFLPANFRVSDYLNRLRALNLNAVGGAVVSGSFQGLDQNYLVYALSELGDNFVGVTQIPAQAKDFEILNLHQAGVRAVRFNLHRGGSAGLESLETLAHRVYALAGWHIELYLDSRYLVELAPRIAKLPRVSLDHLGLSQAGFPELLKAVEKGLRIKATGFSRGDLDIPKALKEIDLRNPKALMFGSDLPSTRAPKVFDRGDLDVILQHFDAQACQRILIENARVWYGTRVASA